MSLKKLAQKWRAEMGYSNKGGVVVIYQGKIQGWVNKLRDPQSWVPGCVAVDDNGQEWVAAGGNDQDGAERWDIKNK